VSSNDVLLVTNYYDAKSRRVKKVTPSSTITFFYDDWNLIEERIAYTNGTTSTIKYYWGKDISGSFQGAGGVGGLLYQTVDDVIYIPCYDNNGNITKYIDANGNIVASYTYNAFGCLISKSGVLADFFRHRFSTKYFDAETCLYYNGYRFYHPILMRWLNLDPIGEDGGVNLYEFCRNNGVVKYDKDGCAYFIKRRLDYTPWIDYFAQNPKLDKINREVVHEQLVFEDGDTPPDVGYFSDSTNKTDSVWKSRKWIRVPGTYNDCVMRKAVAKVKPLPYSLLGDKNKGVPQYNCQDYADALRSKYYELIKDKKIRCECGIDKSK
jgi:RHS repeat-associated protein